MVRIEGLRKAFGSLEVLRDINLDVMPGQVVTVIGPSGSGKSTLLRCINLLETPDAGHVWFHGEDLAADHVNVNALREKIGMVFQGFTARSHPSRSRRCRAKRRSASPWGILSRWAWRTLHTLV